MKNSSFLKQVKYSCSRNKLVLFFFISHVLFAIFLGRLFAFAPDEEGYLYTFNNIYRLPISTDAQSGSGWLTAPTIFLWMAYLPAKILNILGVPDFLSIRFLSISITTFSLFLLLRITLNMQKSRVIAHKLILLSFFIPSVFLWTSTGLRESFIIFEITLFLCGLNYLLMKKSKKGIFLLFVGSYGLLSTKWYLWIILFISLIVFLVGKVNVAALRIYLIKFMVAGFIAPLILFAATTSQYALNIIFNGSISEAGDRCGDSISQIQGISFRGDSILIDLKIYMAENPKSVFTKSLNVLNLDDKVQSLWNEKLQTVVTSESTQVCKALKPGLITKPWTMLLPALVFLAGPFPFVGNPGIAATIASFESPLWWCLYALVIYQFYTFRRFKLFRDPAILFTFIFLAGEIAFSSLVEVNLGTSFRHRSILLVPLVFLYVRITQRAHELPDSDSKQTT